MFRPISCLVGLMVFLLVGLSSLQPEAMAQDRFYAVHVSSCQLPENAEQEVSAFQGRGYEAFSRHETIPGKGMWYRVYVGRFNSPQEAAQFGNRLKAQGLANFTEVRPITGYAKAASAPTSTSSSSGRYDSLLQPAPASSSPARPQVSATAKTPSPSATPASETAAVMDSPEPVEPVEPMEPVEPEPAVEAEPSSDSREATPYWASSSSYRGPFTLTSKVGADFWGNAEAFKVNTTSGGTRREFWIDDARAFHFAVVPSYRVYDFLSVDGGLELMKSGSLNAWYLTLGTRATYEYNEFFAPYARVGLVYGSVNWDGLPGGFENSFGWETGLGLDYLYEQMRFGLELQYRSILFDYNQPAGVEASASELDLSGFSLSGSFGYNF